MRQNINTILRHPAHARSCKYGAPLGRRNTVGEPSKLYLQPMRLVDGDYGADGTYWGSGSGRSRMWAAFSKPHESGLCATLIFVRACSRKDAKRNVIEELEKVGEGAFAMGWGFYR